jgi:hypothetical protein
LHPFFFFFFLQICEVGWLLTNCQCLYAHVTIFFFLGRWIKLITEKIIFL